MKTKPYFVLIAILFYSFNIIANENYNTTVPPLPPPAPANDLCADAIALTVQATCSYTTYSNVGATATSGPADPGCSGTTYKDVWFSVVVPANGSISIDTQTGSLSDCGMALYTGTCGALSLLACNDDGSPNGLMPKIATFGLTPGSTVYVRFWDYNSNDFGTFGICVTSPSPPAGCGTNPAAGDLCGAATSICNFNGYCGNTSSSYNPDEPGNLSSIFCGSIENNSWLKFVASGPTTSFNVFVTNCSMGYGIQMEIYKTPDCSTFTSYSNCFNPGTVTNGTITATGLTAGQTYYLMIDGNSGDVCDYSIVASSGIVTPGTVTASRDTICTGQTSQLTANGGTTYQWSPTTGLSNPNIANPVASPTTTTTYTVTITGGSTACPITSNPTITIVVNNITPATATNNGPLCLGQTLNLTSTPNSALSYSWSGPSSYTSTLQNPTRTNATAAMSGTYTVTVTTTGGCISTATTSVVVNASPTATATCNTPCEGSNLNLSVLPAGTSYQWSGPNSFTNTNQNPVITGATPSHAGTYYVTVTQSSGCTSTGSCIAVVNPLPVVSASNDGPKCAGSTLNLSSLPAGATNYSWSGPNSYTSAVQNPSLTSSTTAMSGNYIVTVTAAGGCTGTAQTSVIINSNPSVTPTSNSPICQGQTLNLTLPVAGTTYAWSGPSSFTSAIQNPSIPNATTSNSGTYSVTVSNSSNCTGTATVSVTVNALPIPTITGDSVICNSESTTLTAGGGSTYLWSNSLPTPSISIAPTTTTTYTVTVTTSANCIATLSRLVSVNPNPQITSVSKVDENCNTSNGSATVNITSGQPPITYTWSNGGANSPTINNLTAGNYSVTVSSGNGCTSSSNFTIANIFGPQLIVSNLVDDHCGKGVGQATVTVTNSTGSFTYTWLLTPPQVGQTVTGLSEGVYLVAVTDGTCSDTISIPIANMPNPTANFEPSPSITTASNAAIRFINQSVGGYTYNWFFGDGDTSTLVSPVHNYLSSQTYTVLLQVTDEYGCIDTISKTIIIYEDLEVFIPNAFTPNGDGKNDIFRPYGKGYKLDGYEMLIFDRWGKMIFQTNTFDKGWDGRVDGTLANINAVFMYKMVIRDLNNQEHRYRGTFTILGSKNALGN